MTVELTSDCVDFAKTVNGWAYVSLKELQISREDSKRVFQASLAMRSLVYFQAILALNERGLIEPTGALMRVLAESAFVVVAIRKEPALLQELERQDLVEKRKALDALRNLSENNRPEWLSSEVIDELHAQTDSANGGSGFNAHFWAEKADMKDVYNTAYRMLNVFSHGSSGALSAYLKTDEEGVAIGITGNAHSDFAPQILINAAAMIVNVIDGLLEESPMSGYFATRLGELQDRFDSQ